MEVLHVTSSYPRFQGDYHGSFIHSLCTKLSDRGLEIRVLAPRTRTLRRFETNHIVTRFPYLPIRGVEIIPESSLKGASSMALIQLPPYLLSAFMHTLSETADVVHAHLAIPMGVVASLDARTRPKLITCHGSDCTLPIENPIYRPFIRMVFKRAQKVIAVSNYVRELCYRLGAEKDKVETLFLGVDVNRFRPSKDKVRLRAEIGIPENSLVVGSLGRLVPEKRIEDLLNAAVSVSDKLDVFFLIGGDGPHGGHIKELAGRMDNVLFMGRITDPSRFYRLCDVFVLASIREGLSISLQEAMASGCVPVAVDGCGNTELIVDGLNGFLFEAMDTVDLADRIIDAAQDITIGVRARSTIVEGFNTESCVERYLEIYRELLC